MKHKGLWLAAALILLISGAIAVLGFSETAFAWMVGKTIKAMPGELSVQVIEGRLLGPITLRDVRYRQETTFIHINSLQLDWRPLGLLAGRLDIHYLEIADIDISLTKSDAPPAKEVSQFALPLTINLADLRLRNLRLRRDDQQYLTLLHQLQTRLRLDAKALEIPKLNAELPDLALQASGQIGARHPHPLELHVDWNWHSPWATVLSGRSDLEGNLEMLQLMNTLTAPSRASLSATVNEPLNALRWQAQLEADEFELSRWFATAPELHIGGKVEGEGDLHTFVWQGQFALRSPEYGKYQAKTSGRHIPEQWLFESFTLQSDKRRMQFALEGSITPASSEPVKLQGRWKNLHWPLLGKAVISSPSGSYAVQGAFTDYRLQVDATVQGPQIPQGHWRLAGTGQQTGLNLDKVTGRTLEGHIKGALNLTWSPALQWQAMFNGQQLDPAVFWPVRHGRLSADIKSQGSVKNGTLQSATEIENLSGVLNGQKLQGAAHLSTWGERYQLSKFELSGAHANINLRGRIDEQWRVKWSAEAQDLSLFSQLAGGQLASHGEITGPRRKPRLQASLKATNLMFGAFSVEKAQSELDVDMSLGANTAQPSRLTIQAHAIRFNALNIDTIRINGKQVEQFLSFEAFAQGENRRLSLHASGPLSEGRWQGQLQQADFESPRFLFWHLKSPSAFTLSATEVQLEPVCWISSEAELCVSAKRPAQANWQIDVSSKQFPLVFIEWFVPAGIHLTGRLDGNAQFEIRDKQTRAKANWRISPGMIVYTSSMDTVFSLNHHGGTLHIDDAAARLNGAFNLELERGDHLRLNAAWPEAEITLATMLPESIHLQTQLSQLDMLTVLFPELLEVKGQLNTDLTMNNIAAQPQIHGYVQLQQASATLPDLGIKIQNLMLSGRAKDNTVQFTGNAHSGKGEINIHGQWQLERLAGWPLQLTLEGKHFEIIHTPEAWVEVSPRLSLQAAHQRIDMQGEIEVPQAKLEPIGLPEGVTVSRDAVIISTATDEADHYAKWAFYGSVNIKLGENVYFNGFGLRGKLTGEVLTVETPQTLTTGTGKLTIVDGQYRVYGKTLDVDPGRLIFAGGPIDDPGIDASALHRGDEIIAGVRVRGTLKAPELTLFSEPVMPDSDILAYMLLGRPLEQTTRDEARLLVGAASLLHFTGAQGLNDQIASRFGLEEITLRTGTTPEEGVALVLGKYLSPRLYVSYAVGLVEPSTSLRARYKLGKKLYLQGESSNTQSGADILYTIER